MKVDNSLQLGVLGIRRAFDGVRESAGRIASSEQMTAQDPAGIAKPLVDLKTYELQAEASAEVVKTVDRMIGSLFDDKA